MTCSKKNWAYTFVGFGGTFLVIGVVCGFVIPKIVIGIVEDQACVDSRSDSNYDDWAKEKPSSLVTKLYYWEITNKDGFLYNGELPKLRERGPYVYKQTTQKINVSFENNQRSSKTWKKDAKFYKEESCKNCKEDDQITVLNMGYVALMEMFGSDEVFAMVYLPVTIPIILQQFNNSYEQLGNTRQTVWQDPLKSGWTNPGFGAWVHAQPWYKPNNTMNFTIEEMKGLYGLLGNKSLLFGETANTTLKAQCKWNKNPVQTKCGWFAQMEAVAGLKNRSQTNTPKYFSLIVLINGTLCPKASQCFKRLDLLQAIFSYIGHVNQYTMWVILGEQFEIVTTMSQKSLTLGYTMKNVINPKTGRSLFIPGIVKVHTTERDARIADKESTFYTCEAGDSKKYQWAAYDGKTSTSAIANMTAEDSAIHGYSMIVPRSDTADKPCTFSHELPYTHLEIFASAIGMRVMVRYMGETSLHGLELKRFTPNKDDFLNHNGVQQGYIDFTVQNKVPSFLSYAHLLYANVTVPVSFNQTPNVEKHQSIVDIEPVTGFLVRAYMRLQLNIPIKKDIVKVPRIKGPLNISYLAETNEKLYLKSIPVLWGKYGGEGSEDDIDIIKQKVIGTLGLACGILIALPVLGCIFIIVAIVLFVIGAKANQISEMSK